MLQQGSDRREYLMQTAVNEFRRLTNGTPAAEATEVEIALSFLVFLKDTGEDPKDGPIASVC